MTSFHLKSVFSLIAACSLAIPLSTTFAEKPDEALKQLKAAVEKELEQADGGRRSALTLDLAAIQQDTDTSSLINGALDQALRSLRNNARAIEVNAAVARLEKAIEEERNARIIAHRKALKAELAATSKALISATKPSDLDGALNNLKELKESGNDLRRYSSDDPTVNADNAMMFIWTWQDQLSDTASGQYKAAIEKLELAKNHSLELVPRSEILARIEGLRKRNAEASSSPDQRSRRIVRETKSLDAIPKALDDLSALRHSLGKSASDSNSSIAHAERGLSALLQAYREWQAGIPVNITLWSSQSQFDNLQAETTPLKVELIRLIAPQMLKAGKVEPSETIEQYLDRIMVAAQKEVDAKMIARVQDFKDLLMGKPSSFDANLGQLKTTIAGKDLEEAGQWRKAVGLYHQALQSGGDLVPAKAIGARIEAIKAAHPDQFPKGPESMF